MLYWQYFYWREQISLPINEGSCWNLPCANFLDHLDFRLYIFGSHSRNQDEFTVSFMLRRKFIFLFQKEAVQILNSCKISWSFGLQPWCTSSILFKEANLSPHQWRQMPELSLVLTTLTIWISDNLSLAHIVKIRMNSLSVIFQDGGSSCYFSRKLFEFLAYAHFLDHLDCSHGALAVF